MAKAKTPSSQVKKLEILAQNLYTRSLDAVTSTLFKKMSAPGMLSFWKGAKFKIKGKLSLEEGFKDAIDIYLSWNDGVTGSIKVDVAHLYPNEGKYHIHDVAYDHQMARTPEYSRFEVTLRNSLRALGYKKDQFSE